MLLLSDGAQRLYPSAASVTPLWATLMRTTMNSLGTAAASATSATTLPASPALRRVGLGVALDEERLGRAARP